MAQVPQVSIGNISKGRRFVSTMAGKTLLPLLMTEACVETGRTYQAYKRGGFTEARERITEEFLGALCWFGAIPVVDSLLSWAVGDKIMHLPKEDVEPGKVRQFIRKLTGNKDPKKPIQKLVEFDVGIDAGRDSISNYVDELLKTGKFKGETKESLIKKISNYRALKIGSAVLAGTLLVGCVLPKFNQWITRTLKSKENREQQANAQVKHAVAPRMDSFMANSSNANKDVAFTGGMVNFVNLVENTPIIQLATEDIGVASGRAANARNKYERREILFRDLTSAYFYLFNMPVWAAMWNKIEHGKWNRLDSISSKMTENHLTAMLNEHNGKMSVGDFEKAVFGQSIPEKVIKKIDNLKDGRIELDKFNSIIDRLKVKDADKLKQIAEKMAELQPGINGKKILTASQVKDVLSGGAINTPEFMHDLYIIGSTKNPLKNPNKNTYKGIFGFISEEIMLKRKICVKDFVNEIIENAKKSGSEINVEMIKKASKKNYGMNAFNVLSGFALTAIMVSTVIPKLQYWITKKTTGSDKFPGTEMGTDKSIGNKK